MGVMLRHKQFFLLPGLIVLIAIIIFPLLFTIRVSFSSWDVVKPGLDWIAGKNYARLFDDLRFWEALSRLSLMAIGSVLIQYVIGFGLALLVWRDVVMKRFLRVLFLVPMMTTPVIMTVVWRTILHESLGPANDIVQFFGLKPLTWLSTGGMAMLSVILVEVWQWTPFMFLLLLAVLLSLRRAHGAYDGADPFEPFQRHLSPKSADIRSDHHPAD
jgi:multiple sugar transport system permease protein